MQPRTSHPDDFAAFVGLDWADAKHDICLQAADTDKPEACVLQHKPEAIEAWVSALRQRFQGQPIAIALELDNVIANLELMPLSLNQRKGNKVTSRQVSLARKLHAEGVLSDAGLEQVLGAAR